MAARVAGSVGIFFFLEVRDGIGWTSFIEPKSTASRLMNLFLEVWTNRFHWERT